MGKREQPQIRDIMTYPEAFSQLTLAEKVGQFFMPAAFINDTEEEILRLEKFIKEHNAGGLCFFHSRASAATNYEENLADERPKKAVIFNEKSLDILVKLIQRYQNATKYPLLIAIDAEWGLAMRIENTPQYPYAITLGAIQSDNELVFEVGRQIAKDCKATGIHWNLAPVADINNNPHNPVIGYRSFGEDRHLVAEKAMAYVKGTQSEGVLTSIKHFPGHGDTETDSHLGLPLITKSKTELLENELYPFQILIDAGVDSVMVGHLSVPALANGNKTSSSISKDVIKGVLRDEMGFAGVVISDALNMHAVSKDFSGKGELEWLAFDAGNDVLCFAEQPAEGIETILRNASEKQIEESFARVWKLKEKAMQTEVSSSIIKPAYGQAGSKLESSNGLNQKLVLKSLTLLKGSEAAINELSANDFIGFENFHTVENQFFNLIDRDKKFNRFILGDDASKNERNVLLALFPSQVKPINNFGFSAAELLAINTLIETKNVVLYLFGNPYVLNHIDTQNAEAVVIAYQNFEVFQEVAAGHFLGNFEAKGKLSVTIQEL
ncbi:MAG: glycoside hydrolase family 3 protein [Aurantibacter sp.]